MKKKLLTLMTLLVCAASGAWATPTKIYDGGNLPASISTTAGETTTIGAATANTSAVLWYGRGSASIDSNSATFSDAVSFSKSIKTGGKSTYKSGSSLAGVLTFTPSKDGILKVYAKGGGKERSLYVTQSAATSTENDATIALTSVSLGDDKNGIQGIAEAFVEKDKQVVIYVTNGTYLYGMTFEESNSDLTLSSTSGSTGVSETTSFTYTTSSTGTVTVASSNGAVATATVNTATNTVTITGVAVGTANITVTQAADATYTKGIKTFVVNVYDPATVYTLSTASESIPLSQSNIGAQPYLSYDNTSWSSSQEYDGVSGTFPNLGSAGRNVTINVKGVSAFAVRDQNTTANRTYGVSVNNVELKVVTHGGTGIESSGIFETGSTDYVTIKISSKGTGSTYPIKIVLYKETVDAIVSSYEWATLSNSSNCLDFTNVTDVTAYIVTGHSGNAITKEEVTGSVPSNTGLILNGDATTYKIPVVSSGSQDVSSNKLKAGTGTAVSKADGYDRYVLSVKSDKAVFKLINSDAATVPVGKAYLEFAQTPGAPEFLNFDFTSETTGISRIDNGEWRIENVFDLQGRRVAKPTKGLYIVNGKKVVIK